MNLPARPACRCGHSFADHTGCCGRYSCIECGCENYNAGAVNPVAPQDLLAIIRRLAAQVERWAAQRLNEISEEPPP